MANHVPVPKGFRALFNSSRDVSRQMLFKGADCRGWRKGAVVYVGTPIDVAQKQAEGMAKFAGFARARIVDIAKPSQGWEWSPTGGWVEFIDHTPESCADENLRA